MKMEGSLACAGNDWEKAWGRGREKDFQLFHVWGKLQQYKDPLVFLKLNSPLTLPSHCCLKWTERHIRALCESFLHTLFRVLTLKNGSPSWFEQRALRCLSSIPLGLCARFFFFPPPLFRRQLVSPCSRHQKVSHLLPITFGCSWLAASHLGQCGVSARSSLPQTALREGWREGGRERGREGGWDKSELGGQT